MKKFYVLLFALFFCISTVYAQNRLTVSNPHFNVSSHTQGIISDPTIEITPKGIYAVVDMTFYINANSSYKASDSLESVLYFDLPSGSFIHDSWLWLDPNTIVEADLIEKNRAITIYEGIVSRRRDPSLLIKTGSNSYKINVYPLMTVYPRKVRISYSTPIKFNADKAYCPLPINIFRTSEVNPTLAVKINHTYNFTNPDLLETNYSNYLFSTSTNNDVLIIPGTDYENLGYMNLSFNVNNPSTVKLTTFSTSSNGGIYELIIPSDIYNNNNHRKNLIVLDNSGNSSIYTFNEIKKIVRSSLLSDYSYEDSFNIIYEHNGSIVKAYNNWVSSDSANIFNAINNIPAVISGNTNKYEDLFIEAFKFCKEPVSNNNQIILFSNNNDYTSSQNKADGLFNNIKNNIGTFDNKLHIINYSSIQSNISGTYHNANDILYNKLTLAAGGSIYKFNKRLVNRINNVYQYHYDLNAPQALSEIAINAGNTTASYSVNLGVQNGFTYNRFNTTGIKKLNSSVYYTETGKYTGTISPGVTLTVQAILPNGPVNYSSTINNVSSGDTFTRKVWAHYYISDMVRNNTQFLTQEIIDSSINNRVLCDYTAFLAVEPGDTIASNFDDNPNIILAVAENKNITNGTLQCYPNPFSNAINIELPSDVSEVVIYDLFGRIVYKKHVANNTSKVVWNGKSNIGIDVPTGIYIIMAKGENRNYTSKVRKD